MSDWLSEQLPPASDVVELPVNELALRLLRLNVEGQQGQILDRASVTSPGTWSAQMESTDDAYLQDQFLRAFGEAWDWLLYNGLIAYRSASPHTYVTERGKAAATDPHALAGLKATARLDVDLHPRLAHRIRRQFILGEYELAAFAAMREVEIRIRELAEAEESLIGVDLAKQALRIGGPLADPNLDKGEQEATMALFWGALGVFKNPPSHRQVEFDDPTLASEVIFLADLLLRLLDRAEQRVTTT